MWARSHRTPRRALFTPYKVAGGPDRDTRMKRYRVTDGVYSFNNEKFKITDDWTKPNCSHRRLRGSWTGTTRFQETPDDIEETANNEIELRGDLSFLGALRPIVRHSQRPADDHRVEDLHREEDDHHAEDFPRQLDDPHPEYSYQAPKLEPPRRLWVRRLRGLEPCNAVRSYGARQSIFQSACIPLHSAPVVRKAGRECGGVFGQAGWTGRIHCASTVDGQAGKPRRHRHRAWLKSDPKDPPPCLLRGSRARTPPSSKLVVHN